MVIFSSCKDIFMDDYDGILNYNDLNIIFLKFLYFFNSLNLMGSKYREKKIVIKIKSFLSSMVHLKRFSP